MKKIWIILNVDQRKNVLILFILMVFSAFVEMLSIGIVLPVVSLMTEEEIGARFPLIQPLLDILGNPERSELIILAMLFLIFIYFIKTFFLALFAFQKGRLTAALSSEIAKDLYRSYLNKSYTFHLQNNSALLIRNITIEVGIFVHNVISPLLIIIMEIIVVTGILVLIILIDPLGSMIIVSLFLIFGGYIVYVTRALQKKWSVERHHHDGMILQQVQQGLGGVKQVKLLGREKQFEKRFNFHNLRANKLSLYQAMVIGVPRWTFEFLAITGIAIVVILMILKNNDIDSILPVVALFAAAAFRLMPGITRVIQSLNAYRYAQPSIETLYKEVNLMQNSKHNACITKKDFKFQIELNKIDFNYLGDSKKTLDEISLVIKQGDSVGIIGTSGSGKSTLVDIILGLLKPKKGIVKVDDEDIELNLRCWQDQIGYVPQSIFLTDDTLRRNVAFGLADADIDESAIKNAVNASELGDFIESLPSGLDTIVGENGVRLSGGQKQRIGIARALYQNPSVLVFDEATSSLDEDTEKSIMNTIKGLHGKKTIIIISHRLNTVEFCDYLYKVESGRIVKQGDFKTVVGNN